jgi:glutaredoxin
VASGELPRLELRDDTPNLLLTWVDDKGDFHVCQKVAEVPEAARTTVRVVVTDREAGTGQQVYVADLRNKNAASGYPVRTMARTEWEEIGASKRQARLEKLAPSAVAARAPAPSTSAAPGGPVIVYGADWCKPCRDAERYLRQRGVEVVHKNIETSAAAQAEMKDKLRRAGLPTSAQIPVLDVGGEIQLGFNPSAVDRALARASGTRGM